MTTIVAVHDCPRPFDAYDPVVWSVFADQWEIPCDEHAHPARYCPACGVALKCPLRPANPPNSASDQATKGEIA